MTWDEAFNLAYGPMLMAKGKKPRLIRDARKQPKPKVPLSDKARAALETEKLKKLGILV